MRLLSLCPTHRHSPPPALTAAASPPHPRAVPQPGRPSRTDNLAGTARGGLSFAAAQLTIKLVNMKTLLLLVMTTLIMHHVAAPKAKKSKNFKTIKKAQGGKNGKVKLNSRQTRTTKYLKKGTRFKHLTGSAGNNALARRNIAFIGVNPKLFLGTWKRCAQKSSRVKNFYLTGALEGGAPKCTHAAWHVQLMGVAGEWLIPLSSASNSAAIDANQQHSLGASNNPNVWETLHYPVTAMKLK